jgi:hypothetical protein
MPTQQWLMMWRLQKQSQDLFFGSPQEVGITEWHWMEQG